MMWTFSSRTLVLLLILGLTSGPVVQAQTTCRMGRDKRPHQNALWQDEFPNQTPVEALCEGTVAIQDSGEICITGRVSYNQLAEAVGTPIRAPAQGSISISGHLTTGSGNVVLGPEAHFLYDFVTRYTINGVEVQAGTGLANDLVAASNGLIDSFCLDKSFTKEPELYSITHSVSLPGSVNANALTRANVIYASCWAVVAEYHEPSTSGPWFGTITNTLITFAAGIAPPGVALLFPVLGLTGIFRFFVVGTMSTSQFPQPLQAPANSLVENVQIDTEWTTLISAMSDGLFTTEAKVPVYMGTVIKKIEPLTTQSCWPVTAAAIDIQAPKGRGDSLDAYINDHVLPFLEARGTVSIHLGKRIESGSRILEQAMNTYNAQCGVALNLQPDPCYHPACTRSTITTNFTYSSTYFRTAGKKKRKDKSRL